MSTGERWQGWQRLNNEGVRLIHAGDLERAATTLEAAYRTTVVDDVDAEGLARRASTLTHLAALVDHRGDPDRAAPLTAEAIDLTLRVEQAVGDVFGTTAVRAGAYVARAQSAARAGRTDDAQREIDLGLAAAEAHTGPERDLLTATLHDLRAGLTTAGPTGTASADTSAPS